MNVTARLRKQNRAFRMCVRMAQTGAFTNGNEFLANREAVQMFEVIERTGKLSPALESVHYNAAAWIEGTLDTVWTAGREDYADACTRFLRAVVEHRPQIMTEVFEVVGATSKNLAERHNAAVQLFKGIK